ncbi:Hsp20/alpha crystallin family protein [Devosia sp. 1635]|uniref:Hsp20/alpha crystallin family protein n=1 Tax=Devosia sp. 1635 TaxID=2726066 RepID=UPI0015679A65|nr:Hsp20/alpha crystallin family protein [Devosia sp. 1635]
MTMTDKTPATTNGNGRMPASTGEHRQIDALRDRIEEFFYALTPGFPTSLSSRMRGFLPDAELRQTDSGLMLSLELPGMSDEDVKITVQDRTVTVSGEKRETTESQEGSVYRSERSYGSFNRTFTAPFAVDPESVNAKFEKGVLTLTIPKPAGYSDTPKEIPIHH